jgi:hypothetical protein
MPNDQKPGRAHVAISLGGDRGVEAPADPVTFTCTVSVDPSAADHTPGALLFKFSSEPVADNAVTWTAIALAESGGAASTGLHALYQDVFVPTSPADAMETLTIAHEGSWLI